ncbi:unnamed protein product [Protopolystoma xenopodis]|uniref:Uncharacterized protein n=1 Tax=Protopolystoma xenopodis TaxID=117903 RepID=A0A448XPH2_9PLAT|nr:unnamed protein product [Protopolystoma xenopodis]
MLSGTRTWFMAVQGSTIQHSNTRGMSKRRRRRRRRGACPKKRPVPSTDIQTVSETDTRTMRLMRPECIRAEREHARESRGDLAERCRRIDSTGTGRAGCAPTRRRDRSSSRLSLRTQSIRPVGLPV